MENDPYFRSQYRQTYSSVPITPDFKPIYDCVRDELGRELATRIPSTSALEAWARVSAHFNTALWNAICLDGELHNRDLVLRREAIAVAALAFRFLLDLPRWEKER